MTPKTALKELVKIRGTMDAKLDDKLNLFQDETYLNDHGLLDERLGEIIIDNFDIHIFNQVHNQITTLIRAQI